MPLLEYQCPKCKHMLERFFHGRINIPPAPVCPCGVQMEQVEFSVPAKRNPEHGIQK